MHTCDICKATSDSGNDVLLYGEWMIKQNCTVHYFCLLLSTNLPQRGGDSSGMLGFLIRDIRQEAAAAKRRKCAYCKKVDASIACSKCGIYCHLECAVANRCITYFCNEFPTFCEGCAPLDNYQRQLLANPPQNLQCDICFHKIIGFSLASVVYCDSCRKGFTHRVCMQRYALASGYYLRCIWCRKENFRQLIRMQSIFVPDRDATWEREPKAFNELYNQHKRCDQPECLCPNGRDFSKNTWTILLCVLCASAGAHRKCLTGQLRESRNSTKTINFKCQTCLKTEEKLEKNRKVITEPAQNEQIDSSVYMRKASRDLVMAVDDDSPVFSDEETISTSSQITVIESQKNKRLENETEPHQGLGKETPLCQVLEERASLNQDCAKNTELNQKCVDDMEIDETPPSQVCNIQKPPLVIKSHFSSADEPYFYMEVYQYNAKSQCVGTCTYRFKEDDERIKDRSKKNLENVQLAEDDFWYQDFDRGIYQEIDDYIASLN